MVSVLLLAFLTSLSFGHFSDNKEVFSSEESAVATEKSNNLNIFAALGEPKFHSDKFEVTSTSSSQIELSFRTPLMTVASGFIILRADGGDAPDISVVLDNQAPSAF